jgi:hypothetical protein
MGPGSSAGTTQTYAARSDPSLAYPRYTGSGCEKKLSNR